jgi:hypothetical protein
MKLARWSLALGLLIGNLASIAAPVEDARARLDLARQVYQGALERAKVDPHAPFDPEKLSLWSKRWLEAERELAGTADERLAAAEAHLTRMKGLEKAARELVEAKVLAVTKAAEAEFHRRQAEGIVRDAKGH